MRSLPNSVTGQPSAELLQIYEVLNHKKAYYYVKKCIDEDKQLDETIVKDIHAFLTENIIIGGIYRNQEARISGAGQTPPSGNDMYVQIKNFVTIQVETRICCVFT